MLLEVKDLEVAYGDYQVVWGVSLGVAAGESVALLGPNGSGKSTVVNAITGLLRVQGRRHPLRGREPGRAGRRTRARALGIAHVLERRRVFPHLTVLQNLTLGAWHPAAKAARAKSMERVFSLFPRLSERKSQLARTLSGGEQQMLALGRGLMSLPRLLMVDEPFLGLAPQVMEQMKAVFETLKSEGMAILFIEQNVRLALSMASRGYILESGRLAASRAVDASSSTVPTCAASSSANDPYDSNAPQYVSNSLRRPATSCVRVSPSISRIRAFCGLRLSAAIMPASSR